MKKMIFCGLTSLILYYPVHAEQKSSLDKRILVVPGPQQERARIQISGTVIDKDGEPLIGATVLEKESGNGTITNIDGFFSMSVSSDATLKFDYVGYVTQEIEVNGRQDISVVLEENSELLEEVVVVGYGIQRKINASGSVDQVSAKQLEARPMTDVSKGLQGLVPNLNIDFANGEPGQAASINIRGKGSINDGDPLILIDGVPSDVEELNRILPQDIESISILKDAASAAIYGARAAFGVIILTTKTGQTEKVQISYNNSFSWSRPSILPSKTADPYIYLKLKNIAVLNTPWSSGHVASDERLEWARQRSDDPSGTSDVRLNPVDETQWEYMGNRDWTTYFLDKSNFSNGHQISLSGRSERTNYYLSAGIDNENGILSNIASNDNYKRYSLRSKVSYKVWDWLTVSNNTSFVNTKRLRPSYYYSNMNIFYDLAPTDVAVNPDGTWANTDAGVTFAKLIDGGDETKDYNKVQSTFSLETSFLEKTLKFHFNYTFSRGGEDYDWFQNKYRIGYGPEDIRETGSSKAFISRTTENYTIFELYGSYNRTFDKHTISSVVGYNQEYNQWKWFKSEREGLISSSLPSIGLASGDAVVGEQYKDWAIRGVFYRANYIYDNRYIVEFNGRYDGSSRFPKNKRFGFFPSASVAWRVEEEAFFENIKPVMNQFKVRLSYGSLGNQQVSEYGYIPSMTSKQGSYLIDGKIPQIVTSPGLVSDNYTWEKVYTRNLGVDVAFLENRVSATFDIYQRDTKDMLMAGKELPSVIGTSVPKENAADMRTNGWELSITYNDRFMAGGKPLQFGARFILSDNRSKITKFDNPTGSLTQYYKGAELGEIWGLVSDGLFATEEQINKLDQSDIIPWGALDIVPGWPMYKDLNNDGRITKGSLTLDDPGDLTKIGNTTPRFRYGINLNAEWNGFDASIFMQGIAKRDYYPQSYLYWGFYQQPYAGGVEHIYDFYRPEADSDIDRQKHSKSYLAAGLADQNLNAQYPVLQCWLADKNLGLGINESMGLAIPQTKYLLNAAYLRIKNITLGYTLPSSITQKVHMSRVRIYASGDNIIEWSPLKKYFDPEAITDSDKYGYVYPFNRRFSFGVNVTF